MFLKILKNDFRRKKGISVTLFGFIMLSATLLGCGIYVVMVLLSSINNMFELAEIPHFMQMHAGELDQRQIDEFTNSNRFIDKQQTVEMINIDGLHLTFGANEESEVNSVMDLSVVVQNQEFDYLLNMENQILTVQQGEIAVPVYYMQEHQLEVGDNVYFEYQDFQLALTIIDFVRDAQMNSSMVSSKRLLVSQEDYQLIAAHIGETEYLIEFLLYDTANVSTVETMYQNAELPGAGPALNYSTYKLLNALSDGIVAAVIMLVGMLLVVISVLCIRFTFLATIEEEYREIGVLKAIGMKQKHIRQIYLIKYMGIGAFASLAGYILFFFIKDAFTSNILLYLGASESSSSHYLLPLMGIVLMYILLSLICLLILRRFRSISAVEAIRAGSIEPLSASGKKLKIFNTTFGSMNVWLAVKDVLGKMKMYSALLIVFTIATFIMIVPLNLLNTLQSEAFISYMGIGWSDIRIDLQKSDNIAARYAQTLSDIEADTDVKAYASTITSRYKVLGSDDTWENINIETGDFSVFPLQYLNGAAPLVETEIALSYLLATDLEKNVGDTLLTMIGDEAVALTVSGIYQDITNGGKTAKAVIPPNPETTVWYVISLDVHEGISIEAKVKEYTDAWEGAKVTGLNNYLSQTLESTISQLKLVVILALALTIFISILITCLFLKLLIAKNQSQNAILRSIGFSLTDIKKQYLIRMSLLLLAGVLLGTIVSGTLGESVVSLAMSSLGAAKISLIANPLIAYLICPLALLSVVLITTLACIAPMKNANISTLITE